MHVGQYVITFMYPSYVHNCIHFEHFELYYYTGLHWFSFFLKPLSCFLLFYIESAQLLLSVLKGPTKAMFL